MDDDIPELVPIAAAAPVATPVTAPAPVASVAPAPVASGTAAAPAVAAPATSGAAAPAVAGGSGVPGAARVPITVLSGWLGAGKTTLLRHILQSVSAAGKRVAIVQNETSEKMGVEKALDGMKGVSIIGASVASFLTDDKPNAVKQTKPTPPASGAAAAGAGASAAAVTADAKSAVGKAGGEDVFSDLLELSNGCVCCSVRSDFVVALEALLKRRRFDYVMVECSGLADPGALARLFWVDDELGAAVYLDAIVTVVDAKHLRSHLDSALPHSAAVVNQIAYADALVINKTDLITAADLQAVSARVHALNAVAQLLPATHSRVPMRDILDLRAFEARDAAAAVAPDASCTTAGCTHAHTHGHAHTPAPNVLAAATHAHSHDAGITTVTLEPTRDAAGRMPALDLQRLRVWIGEMLWTDIFEKPQPSQSQLRAPSQAAGAGGATAAPAAAASSASSGGAVAPVAAAAPTHPFVYRMKGVLHVAGESRPHYLQAVQEVFDIQTDESPAGAHWPGAALGTTAAPYSRVVVIGRQLDARQLQNGLDACRVLSAAAAAH